MRRAIGFGVRVSSHRRRAASGLLRARHLPEPFPKFTHVTLLLRASTLRAPPRAEHLLLVESPRERDRRGRRRLTVETGETRVRVFEPRRGQRERRRRDRRRPATNPQKLGVQFVQFVRWRVQVRRRVGIASRAAKERLGAFRPGRPRAFPLLPPTRRVRASPRDGFDAEEVLRARTRTGPGRERRGRF